MKTIENLKVLLASQYVLYTKVQNFHWNISGTNFLQIHKLTEGLYEELAEQIDNTAERIRALNEKAPGTLKEFLAISFIQENEWEVNSNLVLEQLIKDYSKLNEETKEIIQLADEIGDIATSDLLSPLVSYYEKTLWILNSSK